MAAKSLLHNEPVYGIPFGLDTGFYKYSPFTLLFFMPFTLLAYEAASIIYFFISTACVIGTIILIQQMMNKYFFPERKPSFHLFLSILLCVLVHLVRELHLGNTNMILLFLLSLSLKYVLESKHIPAGLLLAIVILTKPYFLICLLPLLLFKEYKTLLSTIVSLLMCVAVPGIFIGVSKSISLYGEWLSAMKEHSNYLSSRHTLFSLIDYYAGLSIPNTFGIYMLGLTGLILFVFFWKNKGQNNIVSNKLVFQKRSLIIYYFLLISFVPSLLITDTEHFLFSLPLITILIMRLTKQNNYLWIFLFVLLMLMYGGNSSDLFGKFLAGKFEELGLLGIGNLIIIGSVFYLYSMKLIVRKSEYQITS
jgi:hypothetical protein